MRVRRATEFVRRATELVCARAPQRHGEALRALLLRQPKPPNADLALGFNRSEVIAAMPPSADGAYASAGSTKVARTRFDRMK